MIMLINITFIHFCIILKVMNIYMYTVVFLLKINIIKNIIFPYRGRIPVCRIICKYELNFSGYSVNIFTFT